MKTRYLFSLVAAAVMVFGGQNLQAQYPGQFGPGPGFQPPGGMMQMQPPGMMPSSPIVSANFAQQSPFGSPAAFIPASQPMYPPQQVSLVGHEQKCDGKGCGKSCDSCQKGKGGKGHGYDVWEVYGEFLYLRARDAEVAYAVNSNGPITPGAPRIQISPVGVVDPEFQPGFRFGIAKSINDCTKILAEYTMYESNTTDTVVSAGIPIVRSFVLHPSTNSAATDFRQVDGDYDIVLDQVDLDVRREFYNDGTLDFAWLLGVRGSQLEQQLLVTHQGGTTSTVLTDVDFTGVGLKFGLDAGMCINDRWSGYVNFSGSFVPGQFNASFDQVDNALSTVDTTWEAGRIVTIWDLELGVSRVSRCGNFKVNAGYQLSAWTNTVQTDDWIDAIHTNDFTSMDSTMTFDGLVARVEARF